MIKSAWITFSTLLLALAPAYAQNFGEFAGNVADPSGAVIAGARVTIANDATGVARTAETNEAGNYTVPFLNPGVYTITAEADGFRTARTPGLVLQVGATVRNNFTLEVGVVTEVVEVEAAAQMLQTQDTAVGTVIDNERIVELPINGRNYLNLVKLSPNVSAEMQSGGQADSRQGGERANQSISIAGQRQQFNRYTLDGVENTDPNFNTFIVRPSVDAIQEFKVQTGVYSAEFGKATSQVTVTTKGGTNEFHGTVYEFLRNDKIQARTWGQHGDKDPFRRNQYGFTATGPVIKNRLFFMGNFEGLRESVFGFNQATVANAAMRRGDFSGPEHARIYDPTTVTQFAPGRYSNLQFQNNIIPESRIHPVSKKLLEFYPNPTEFQAVHLGRPNYTRDSPRPVEWDQFTGRGDFTESATSQWFGRYSWGGETVKQGRNFEFQDERITTDVQQIMLSNTRTFSPTLVNELRLGVSLFDNDKLTRFNGERDVTGELAIPGMPSPAEVNWGTPAIGMAGRNDYLDNWGESTEGPFINRNRNFQIVNNTSWIRGNHAIKFGIDISEARYAQTGNQFGRGEFIAENLQTARRNPEAGPGSTVPLIDQSTGTAFATFLTGYLNEATRSSGLPNVQFRRKPVMLYLEDTWKVTPKLTLNIGLRYENTPPWHDKHAGYVNVLFHGCLGVDETGIDEDCPTPTLVRPGNATDFHEGLAFHFADIIPKTVSSDALYSRRLIKWDTNDFAPRLGISWAPDAKTTIRTGYGFFYAQDTANPVFDMARNFGARDTNRGTDAIPTVNFDGPWASKAAGGACSGWSGNCVNGLYTFANDAGRKTPNIQQWLFNVQRQVTSTFMVEAGYMGSVGHNLQKMHGWNQPLLRAGPGDNTTENQRRPWGGEEYGVIQTISSLGNSNYHAFAFKALQRTDNGLTYLVGYTWAKSIDDSSAIRTNGGDNLFPANHYDFRSERGLSQFHTKHRLTASILYDVPLRFDNNLLQALAGGWQTGAIFTFSTGTPIGQAGCGNYNFGAGGRPDVTGINPNSGPKTAQAWWSKGPDGRQNSYTCSDPGIAYRYGNSSRNQLITPGVANMDFSLTKDFRITESAALEFRFESFNFTNHPNWNAPSTSFDTVQYGVITAAGQMRTNQFGLKLNF